LFDWFLLFIFLIYILSSNSEILSSTCSILLDWPSTVFFVWLKGLCISKISFDSFFLRFYIPFNSSFIFCIVIWFIYFSFYSVLCFTFVFVEVLSEFISLVFVSSHVLYFWCFEISWVHLIYSG
jgi:hypothetical protein